MRHQFQYFVAYQLSASPAKRKNGVAHQEHGSARLIVMANFINSRKFNHLSRFPRAIGLVKIRCSCDVIQFHVFLVTCLLVLSCALRSSGAIAEEHSSVEIGMRAGLFQVGGKLHTALENRICCSGNPERLVIERAVPIQMSRLINRYHECPISIFVFTIIRHVTH
jgi:hypothetical protein